MDYSKRKRLPVTFTIKPSTNLILNDITRAINEGGNFNVSKSQVVDVLIQDAKIKDLTRLLLLL